MHGAADSTALQHTSAATSVVRSAAARLIAIQNLPFEVTGTYHGSETGKFGDLRKRGKSLTLHTITKK